VDDIAMLHGMGIRLVLVLGAQPQIDRYILTHTGKPPNFASGCGYGKLCVLHVTLFYDSPHWKMTPSMSALIILNSCNITRFPCHFFIAVKRTARVFCHVYCMKADGGSYQQKHPKCAVPV
jgi:hypothetical protein